MKNSSSSLLIKRQSKEGIVSVYNKILKKYPSSSLFVKRRNKSFVTLTLCSRLGCHRRPEWSAKPPTATKCRKNWTRASFWPRLTRSSSESENPSVSINAFHFYCWSHVLTLQSWVNEFGSTPSTTCNGKSIRSHIRIPRNTFVW